MCERGGVRTLSAAINDSSTDPRHTSTTDAGENIIRYFHHCTDSGRRRVDPENRNHFTSEPFEIEAFTRFTFPGRQGKYSKFIWDHRCFTGVDYAHDLGETAIFSILNDYGEGWEDVIDTEKGNYDYLMFCDVEFRNMEVREELKRYGAWLLKQTAFDGVREELKFYYSAADVFITTPWYEPFGITPLEAMACGTPVIGSNVGGIKFSVADGETGFLVPPTNSEAVAEKVAMLLGDQQLSARMKRNALIRVNKQFTWKNVCVQLSRLYNKLGTFKSEYHEIKSCIS